ncbi:hypothetical protein PXO_00629 [Xanthomonas oryzae pv. oryzae PXO99A]|uniref:UvrD-like helicase ATP-binding domain-containing protein n=2 Tax=Xanthomonas oryzae TaxID=347 RepID=A0A0K0GKT6_XANOP|nr:hypothetical protein PXO_00629 [Xanthomonas oryzae pv. oryzae PXO99A]
MRFPRMSRCAAGMDFCCASASARTRLRFALSLGSRRSCSSTGAPTTAPHAHKSRDTIWPATECTPIGRPTYAVRCDELTQGQVMARLADMYDELYIDEVQDLAGYDLDLVERLLKSDIAITLVGDTRQATYATNYASRHSQYRGPNLAALFQVWESDGLCQLDHRLISLRCVQALCDLADALYPQMPRTKSSNGEVTGHDGIYLVAPGQVAAYMQEFAPTVLRYDRRQACDGLLAVNFGQSKGRTYSRVLIFPNGPLTQYLRTADASRITAPPKYYVAFTRARQSVAFVYAGACALPGHQLYAPSSANAYAALTFFSTGVDKGRRPWILEARHDLIDAELPSILALYKDICRIDE